MKIEILLMLLLSTTTADASMDFFDSKIDYWNSQSIKSEQNPSVQSTPPPKSAFPWNTYLDPKNKEFFKEGDYTPPEPFMEVARSPTDENIQSWFEFMKKKNELAKRLDDRMREYMAKNGMSQNSQPEAKLSTASLSRPSQTEAPPRPIDPKRFRFRMYFDSTCPHCHDMFGVLAHLKSDGFAVEAMQVDRGPVPPDERIVSIFPSSIEELKARGGHGFPFLEIADTTRQGILPAVEGFHDYGEIMKILREADK